MFLLILQIKSNFFLSKKKRREFTDHKSLTTKHLELAYFTVMFMSSYCEEYLKKTVGTMDHWGLLMWFNNMKAFTKIADALTRGQSFNGLCFCLRPVMCTVVTWSTARWVKIGGDRMQAWENERKRDKSSPLWADFSERLHSLHGCRGPLICFLWINSVYKHHWNVTPSKTSYWFS